MVIYFTFNSASGPLPLARGGLGWGPLEALQRFKRNECLESVGGDESDRVRHEETEVPRLDTGG
ncbi:hypothetical protein NG791_13545 [Laspinema sp. D1]|uniref:hypothetical protein n=1 Tax=Laspinema palackyanum TaxID=3231601 RepID=UPI00349A9B26|nr:hypothetical protein [Laspinema sp. D2b]